MDGGRDAEGGVSAPPSAETSNTRRDDGNPVTVPQPRRIGKPQRAPSLSQIRQAMAPEGLPVEYLPEPLRGMVSSVSEHSQTPPDYGITVALGAAAGALRGIVSVVSENGHSEPVILRAICAAAPGSRKSSVVAAFSKPLEEIERHRIREARPDVEAHNLDVERLQKARKDAVHAKDPARRAEAQDEAERLSECVERIPPSGRLLVGDVTPEALAPLLAADALVALSAEGESLAIGQRYKDGPGPANLDLLLKSYDREAMRVDRKGGGSTSIPSPALSMGLLVQPTVLDSFMSPENLGRGAVARCLIACPRTTVGGRRSRGVPPISAEASARYADALWRLSEVEPTELELDDGANDAWHRFHDDLEPRIGPGGDLEMISPFVSKLRGTATRLAGLFHVVECGPVGKVGRATFERAAGLASAYITHARSLYSRGQLEDAEALVEFARGRDAFTYAQLANNFRRRFSTKQDFGAVAARLIAEGILFRVERAPGAKGGRPSVRYTLEPPSLTSKPAATETGDQSEPPAITVEPSVTSVSAVKTGSSHKAPSAPSASGSAVKTGDFPVEPNGPPPDPGAEAWLERARAQPPAPEPEPSESWWDALLASEPQPFPETEPLPNDVRAAMREVSR